MHLQVFQKEGGLWKSGVYGENRLILQRPAPAIISPKIMDCNLYHPFSGGDERG